MESRVLEQNGHVLGPTRYEIVHADHVVTFIEEPLAQVRSQEAGGTSHEDPHQL
jgi:hypothetical protein